MAKVQLKVAPNVTLKTDDGIARPGEVFTAERSDETERWLAHGYAEEVRKPRAKKKQVARSK